jgi:hypothetical protein
MGRCFGKVEVQLFVLIFILDLHVFVNALWLVSTFALHERKQ